MMTTPEGKKRRRNDDVDKPAAAPKGLLRCGSCMYFWPYCDVCLCPPPHQYCQEKHPMLRKLEQEVGLAQQTLLEWDQTLSPKEYVKTLVRICRRQQQQQPNPVE
jgi:hypothetical protein